MTPNLHLCAGQLPAIAKEAGRIITAVRDSGDLGIVMKETYGKPSPFTRADTLAHDYLTAALQKLTPDIPVVSEESDLALSAATIAKHDVFWLMDPLDGTKSFINGRDDFAVNIALIDHGAPVLGAVYFPAQQLLYYTGSNGKAYRQRGEEKPVAIHAAACASADGMRIAIGHKDDDASIATLGMATLTAGKDLARTTNARRICRIAEGESDLALGTKATSTWDTAGPDAVLRAAGGTLMNHATGRPMIYGREAFIDQDGAHYPLANPPFLAGHTETLGKFCGLQAIIQRG